MARFHWGCLFWILRKGHHGPLLMCMFVLSTAVASHSESNIVARVTLRQTSTSTWSQSAMLSSTSIFDSETKTFQESLVAHTDLDVAPSSTFSELVPQSVSSRTDGKIQMLQAFQKEILNNSSSSHWKSTGVFETGVFNFTVGLLNGMTEMSLNNKSIFSKTEPCDVAGSTFINALQDSCYTETKITSFSILADSMTNILSRDHSSSFLSKDNILRMEAGNGISVSHLVTETASVPVLPTSLLQHVWYPSTRISVLQSIPSNTEYSTKTPEFPAENVIPSQSWSDTIFASFSLPSTLLSTSKTNPNMSSSDSKDQASFPVKVYSYAAESNAENVMLSVSFTVIPADIGTMGAFSDFKTPVTKYTQAQSGVDAIKCTENCITFNKRSMQSTGVLNEVSGLHTRFSSDKFVSDSDLNDVQFSVSSTFTKPSDLKASFSSVIQTLSSSVLNSNGDNSGKTVSLPIGYFPSVSSFLGILETEFSQVNFTLLESGIFDIHHISATPVTEASQPETAVSASDVSDSPWNDVKPVYRHTTEVSLDAHGSKDWPVPVTICLSVLLFLTWIILLRQCRKSRSAHDHEVGESSYTPTEGQRLRPGNTTHMSSPGLLHSQEQQLTHKSMDRSRSYVDDIVDSRDGDACLRNPHPMYTSVSEINGKRKALYLDNMSQTAKGHSQDFRVAKDTRTYNNRSFLPSSDSLDSLNSRPHSVLGTSQSNGRISSPGKPDRPAQRLSPIPNSSTFAHDLKSDMTTVHDVYSRINRNSSPRVSPSHDDNKERLSETALLPTGYVNKGYNHDFVDNGKHRNMETRYIIREDEEDENAIRIINDDGRIRTAEEYFIEPGSGTWTVGPVIPRIRPGMSKCVSFDESQLQMARDKIFLHKNKSPTRRISTISDSAAAHLPGEGFLNMSGAYETIENLAEIGKSPIGSRFFIGSYPEDMNLLGRSSRKSSERLDVSAVIRKEDEFESTGSRTLTSTSMEKRTPIKSLNHQFSDARSSNPSDDYIFPIVRNAKTRILAERQQRKQLDKRNSDCAEGNDEAGSFAPAQTWQNTSRKSEAEFAMKDQKWSPNKSNSPSSPAAETASTASSNPRSPTSKIPRIILTHDEGESEDVDRSKDVASTIELPRVRRIARVNNPFLIEVDASVSGTSEKLRRSSAPAMAHSKHPLSGTGVKDRMSRSASGDRLCIGSPYAHLDHIDPNTTRSWSSEFLNLMRNSKPDNPSDDERFKKMVDDRYNALFRNKYPDLRVSGGPDKQNFPLNQSAGMFKFMTALQEKRANREVRDSADDARASHFGDSGVFTTYQPHAEVQHSPYPSADYMKSDSERRRIPSSDCSSSETENVTRVASFRNTSARSADSINVSSSRDGKSPRPSLTHGTDGLDNDTEPQRTNSEKSWVGNVDRVYSKDRPFTAHVNSGNGMEVRRVPVTKLQWESFDNDFETGHLCSSTPISEKAFTPERDWGQRSPIRKMSERASPDTLWRSPLLFKGNNSDFIEQGQTIGVPVHELQYKDGIDKINRGKQIIPSDRAVRSPFVPIETPSTDSETEPISPSSSKNVLYPLTSCINLGHFDDNFDMNMYHNPEKTKSVNQNQSVQKLGNPLPQNQEYKKELKLEKDDKERLRTTESTPPVKQPRRHRKNRPENERFRRSPYVPSEKDGSDISVVPTKDNNSLAHAANEQISGSRQAHQGSAESHVQLASRSLSCVETSSYKIPSIKFRAVSLDTGKLESNYLDPSDWAKRFREDSSMFVSSANNTLLQHSSSEDTTYTSTSLSEPEMQLYFAAAPASGSSATQPTGRRRARPLILSDNRDSHLQVSNI